MVMISKSKLSGVESRLGDMLSLQIPEVEFTQS